MTILALESETTARFKLTFRKSPTLVNHHAARPAAALGPVVVGDP
jgi:hypothetical protein